jgi:hypothetical protein
MITTAEKGSTTSLSLDPAPSASAAPKLARDEKAGSPASITGSRTEKVDEPTPHQVASRQSRLENPSIRSRTSRRTDTEGDSENTDELPTSAEKAVRDQVEERGLIRRTPLYRYPIRGSTGKWHEEVDTPSQWTSLFYGASSIFLSL